MRMSYSNYTLGDLLSEPGLGLELVAGGEDALLTPVAGAHSIELDNPAKWLDAGWMMLTVGLRLRNKPRLQRELVAELQQLGASCLGFGVGHSFKSVPPVLLDEARRRNFPVLVVPEETNFRDIIRAVFQSTVGIESATFQRLSSIQQNMMRAFADPDPFEAIVHRLGRLVNCTIVVMSPDGKVDAATGTIPVKEIAAALRAGSEGMIEELNVDDWQVWAAAVPVPSGPAGRWLVVATRRATVAQELVRASIQVTAPLIGALLRISSTSRGQDRALRQSLLDLALDDRAVAIDVRTIEARLSALGIDLTAGFRAVVARERPSSSMAPLDDRVAPEDLVSWLHSRLESLGGSYLLSHRQGEVVTVVPAGPALEAVTAECAGRWPALTVGIGRPIASAQDIRESYRDGQIVVRHLAVQSDHNVMGFDEVDIVTQLLAEVPMERFAAKAGPIAALLAENPIQLEALRAYFAMNRDIKAAADSIFVHPNTLRYRLERLEQSLGRSLRDQSLTASLYCVLLLLPDLVPADADQRPADVHDVSEFKARRAS
jgi:hypothetical protein